jgi:hypothetical protein
VRAVLAVVRFGREVVVVAKPEWDVEGAREEAVRIFCHGSVHSKRKTTS